MPQYTVFLTKGTYLVDEEDARRIREAVTARLPFIDVGIDLRCDGVVAHRAEIATAHVVTLVRVPEPTQDIFDEKVRPLFSVG